MLHFLTPLRVLLVFLAVSVPVAFVLPHLNIGLEPAPSERELEVRVAASSFSPYEMEQQILAPLENALSAIRGVKGIRSVAREGEGTITLAFSDDNGIGSRRLEVAAVLRRVYPGLPDGTSYPVLEGGNTANNAEGIPVLHYDVYGNSKPEISCEEVEAFFLKALKAVGSISAIRCNGAQEKELQFAYDTDRMGNNGIVAEDIRSALFDTYHRDFPGLARDNEGNIRPVRTAVASTAPGKLLLHAPGRQPLELSKVAVGSMGYVPAGGYFRLNGREVVRVQIRIYAGANSIREARRIRSQVEKYGGRQQKLHVELSEDHTGHLRGEMGKSGRRALLSVLILLLLLGLGYRNMRMALLLVFSLIIAVSLSLVFGWLIGLKWHPYTLAGIGVGFGLIVDNVIVMLDACKRGTGSRIFPALLTATLTSITALLLVFLLPEAFRRNLEDFARIILLGLLASLLIVKWLVPACYGLWAESRQGKGQWPIKRRRQVWRWLMGYRAVLAFWGKRKGIFVTFWVLAFGFPVFLIPHGSPDNSKLSPLLNAAFFQRTIRPPLERLFSGSLGLFASSLQGRDFFRSPESAGLFVRAELPQHHAPEHIDGLMRPIEAFLGKWKGIAAFYTTVQDGRFGEIEVRFSPAVQNTSLPLRLQSAVQHLTQGYSGVQWSIFGQGASFANNNFATQMTSSEFVLKGYDYRELGRQAEKTAALLRGVVRVSNIRTDLSLAWGDRPMEDWRFRLDLAKLSENRLLQETVVSALRQEASPMYFNLDYGGGNLSVRTASSALGEFDLFRLLHRPIALSGGRMIYLRDLGQLEAVKGNNAIYRENRQYIRRIGYDYTGDYEQARIVHEETLRKVQHVLPAGFSIENGEGGSSSGQGRIWPRLFFLLAGINFFLCALLFESLKKAFVVLIAVPVSFIGVFLVFGSGYFRFDQGGLAAFILLGGIVVNAAIFLLCELEYAPGRQVNYPTTLVKVIFRRSGAILLTVASTVCGLVPFLVDGPGLPFWFALSIGTIGGLIMSLVAVFGIVPVMLWRR